MVGMAALQFCFDARQISRTMNYQCSDSAAKEIYGMECTWKTRSFIIVEVHVGALGITRVHSNGTLSSKFRDTGPLLEYL